jgi:hypothetical protein
MIGILIMLAIGVAVCAAGCLLAMRHLRTRGELRGDWWSRFERDFRSYAAGLSDPQPPHRRHP